jgi:hypothetical protein
MNGKFMAFMIIVALVDEIKSNCYHQVVRSVIEDSVAFAGSIDNGNFM